MLRHDRSSKFLKKKKQEKRVGAGAPPFQLAHQIPLVKERGAQSRSDLDVPSACLVTVPGQSQCASATVGKCSGPMGDIDVVVFWRAHGSLCENRLLVTVWALCFQKATSLGTNRQQKPEQIPSSLKKKKNSWQMDHSSDGVRYMGVVPRRGGFIFQSLRSKVSSIRLGGELYR